MRTRGIVVPGIVVLLAAMLTGCCDQYKKQINEMTLEKDELEAQLLAARDRIDAQDATINQYRDQIAAARNQANSLQQDLDEARKKAQLPKGWQIKKGMIMTSLPNKVLFDAGKAKLKPTASANLTRVIADINVNFPGHDVYIIGHTDSDKIRVSKWRDNLELSLQRAAAVGRYVSQRGLDPKRVICAGCGPYRPIASNATASGKASNRRVEFWVLKPM